MKKKYPRIAATLKYGPFKPLVAIVFLRILFYLGIAMFGISATIFLLSLFGVMEESYFWIVMLLSLLFVGFALIFLIPHASLKRKIRPWLEDAVLLTAQSQTAAVRKVYARVTYEVVKISVKFFYNGEKHIQASGNPEKHKELNGFSQCYWDYTDREIQILYSPTYDQVMILWEDKLNSK